jgi:hypothetical protein
MDAGGGDEKTALYTISIADGIQNGEITANLIKAKAGQSVTVKAVPAEDSEWAGEGDPPDIAGSDGDDSQGGGGAMLSNTVGI